MERLRLAVIGKTGSGKSSTCNSLVGREVFPLSALFNGATMHCKAETFRTSETTRGGANYIRIVDTPGIFDPEIDEATVLSEIQRFAMYCSPGPHIILIVIKVNRYTDEDHETIAIIERTFGSILFDYAIIVFTHIDLYSGSDSFTSDIQSNHYLRDLVRKCNNRYVTFNNKASFDGNIEQCNELIQMMAKLVDTNKCQYYTNSEMEEAAKRLRQEEQREEKRLKLLLGKLRSDREGQDTQKLLILNGEKDSLVKLIKRKKSSKLDAELTKLEEKLDGITSQKAADIKQIELDIQKQQAEVAELSRGIHIENVLQVACVILKLGVIAAAICM